MQPERLCPGTYFNHREEKESLLHDGDLGGSHRIGTEHGSLPSKGIFCPRPVSGREGIMTETGPDDGHGPQRLIPLPCHIV